MKERKLVQWALAYLCGAWVLVEATNLVVEQFSWPQTVGQVVTILAFFGFFVVLVIAWYHGEKDRQWVSGPELLIIVLLLLISGGVLSMLGSGEDSPEQPDELASLAMEDERPAVAVLPCANMSADPADEYLASSLHDEILLKLQRISSLLSIGRTSVLQYAEDPPATNVIATDLGVGFVGECSVQKYGSQIRLIFQLLDGRTGGQVWADDYDRELTAGNLFDIQSDIAQQIASAMRVVLDPEDQTRIAARPTENTEAHSFYMRGRFFWNKRTEEGFRQAIEYFEQALEEDPSYALAYAGIADSYNFLGWQDLLPSEEVYPLARSAAERALMVDETLSEAHASLAYVKLLYDWDWPSAEEGFRRALELNPDYAEARQWYAEYLAYMGRHDESIAEANRAKMLDPLSLGINHNLGLILYEARHFDLAIEEYQNVLQMDPDFVITHAYLGLAYAEKGMFDDALDEIQKAIDLTEGQSGLYLSTLGFIYASMGKVDEAGETLEELLELSKHRYVAPVSIAIIYGNIGQTDRAFEWMEEGYGVRDDYLMGLRVDPRFDSLRSDTRFPELLLRMGLEE
jgi:TolB-like protein/Tfp pilus assembly protein PilF